MPRRHRVSLFLSVIFFTGLACVSLPLFPTADAGAVSTSAAQTIFADFTRNAPQTSTISTATLVPLVIFQTETSVPTPTLTVTLDFTATPFISLISVSTPTNCRSGPGKAYEMEGALLVGEFAEVYGRDPTGNYWYVRNPDSGPEYCWVWGKYATLSGPALLLPVFTPPPTPTPTFTPSPTLTPTPSPNFKAEYAGLDTCNATWWVEVKLKNKGSVPFKSVNISVRDKATDVVMVNLADGFTNMDGCLSRAIQDTLGFGDTYLLSAPAFAYDPTGHEIVLVITLCSDTGQKGMCATGKIIFTP